MSLQIPIQKDIGEYEEKIVGRMSLRTSACVAGGFASAVAVGALCYVALGLDPSSMTFPVMCACLPFWLAGFWRPYGMRVEELAPLAWAHAVNDQRLVFESCLEAPACGPVPGKADRAHRRAAKAKGAEAYEPTKR